MNAVESDPTLDSFGDLDHGEEIAYVGPDEFPGEWDTPHRHELPYRFLHVTTGGALVCLTRFDGKRRLPPEHPANDPGKWRRSP